MVTHRGETVFLMLAFCRVTGEQETGLAHRISTEVLLRIISKPTSFLVCSYWLFIFNT